MAYATSDELQAYLGGSALPSDANRLLERASDLIDYATYGKINISDTEQLAVAKKATCAQVEYWISVGENIDISGYEFESISIGTFQMTKPDNVGGSNQQALAPRTRRILFLAGMLYRGVKMI
jgi:hypothetical protein